MNDKRGFLTLAAEIRQELDRLGRLTEDIARTWKRRETVAPEDRQALVESTALKLHNFYSGWERIFEKIAKEVNGGVPTTPDWHLRLLRSMSLEIPDVRPRVLSPELVERLVEYLRFRHLVRNIYGSELEEDRLSRLVSALAGLSRDLEEEIRGSLTFLENLGDGD